MNNINLLHDNIELVNEELTDFIAESQSNLDSDEREVLWQAQGNLQQALKVLRRKL
jgi:hypothetical protein